MHTPSLDWLLEPADPGVRYLALRDLLHLPDDDPELAEARAAAHTRGQVAEVLAEMDPTGFWVEPGPGYNPKYRSSAWAVILLAQLGADIREDERIRTACAYVLAQGLTRYGQFSATGTPSGTADCLQGNLSWALLALGFDDPRLELAFDWLARSVTGEGVAPVEDRQAELRFYASGKSGPLFSCGANNRLSCAWGAIKVMLACGALPAERRTSMLSEAIRQGAEFLLNGSPAAAGYPNGWAEKPSQNWWKFGFPVFYITDLLQNVEALGRLGYGQDPRLAPALDLVRAKSDPQGRWALEYDYEGKTWGKYGTKKQPNKWVTLRALRALHACEESASTALA